MKLAYRSLSRSMRIALLLIVDSWILDVVGLLAHTDRLQAHLLFWSSEGLTTIGLIICLMNLMRVHKTIRYLEIKKIVLETLMELAEKGGDK